MITTSRPVSTLSRFLERLSVGGLATSVIWDFDGVLAETEPLHEASYAKVAASRGMTLHANWYLPLIGNTEEHNWMTLIAAGLQADGNDLPKLAAQRRKVFASLTSQRLQPTWLAASLIPAFAQLGYIQRIVSNGDLTLIRTAVKEWRVAKMVEVVDRARAIDKLTLLLEHAGPGVVTFDDTDRYIEAAKTAGAYTVGVRHSHNSHFQLAADEVLAL
ncbi:HAD hydrolase-like protein [Streptomyces sp. SID8361]|uniref:HAD hydrolase-like protein n=1 Tax=Streptomyces sp. MnatMP-M27 TaxID=1839768 RepID=UPI00081D95D3|nr:HAD hydrolase-like protein [Streptomyces sp. MnatMP-M27]MYU10411.1 HAD hydrolase-like protein [Streptomyces sp. SID8361]SCF71687.1 Beta-phosphoglucomutase, HAD superfamily [Streptomyces sp. MnatMP-M27]